MSLVKVVHNDCCLHTSKYPVSVVPLPWMTMNVIRNVMKELSSGLWFQGTTQARTDPKLTNTSSVLGMTREIVPVLRAGMRQSWNGITMMVTGHRLGHH